MNYTPGPWTFTQSGGDNLVIKGPNNESVVSGCGCCGSPFGDNLEHDAPLLTAAPDLLEALVLMVRTHDEPADTLLQEAKEQQWLAQARAAIARATGEPHA